MLGLLSHPMQNIWPSLPHRTTRRAALFLAALTAWFYLRAFTSDIPALSILMAGFYAVPLLTAWLALLLPVTQLYRLLTALALFALPSILLVDLIRPWTDNRIKWPFDDANHLCMLFNTGTALSLGLLCQPKQKIRACGLFLLMVCLTGVILSGSRMGLLALLALSVTFALIARRQWPYGWKLPLIGLTIFIAGLALRPLLIANAIDSVTGFAEIIRNPTTGSGGRPDFWADILQLIMVRPWLGYGTATFPYVFAQAVQPNHITVALTAHNDFLQVALETGIVGALLYLGFALILGVGTFSALRPIPPLNANARITLASANAALLALGLQAQVEFMIGVLPLLVVFGLALAVWSQALASTPTPIQPVLTSPLARHSGSISFLAVFISVILSLTQVWADLMVTRADAALKRRDVEKFSSYLSKARGWSLDLHALPYVRAANFELGTLMTGGGDASTADRVTILTNVALRLNPYLAGAWETRGRLAEFQGKSPLSDWQEGLRLEPRSASIRLALIQYYARMGLLTEKRALIEDTRRWIWLKGMTPELKELIKPDPVTPPPQP